MLLFGWSEEQEVKDFREAIRALYRGVKQKCTGRVTGWWDGDSVTLKHSRWSKLLLVTWIHSMRCTRMFVGGRWSSSKVSSYLARDILLDKMWFCATMKPPMFWHSCGWFLKGWNTFFFLTVVPCQISGLYLLQMVRIMPFFLYIHILPFYLSIFLKVLKSNQIVNVRLCPVRIF